MSAGARPTFGTPELLGEHDAELRPVSDGVSRTTTWEFPSRAAVAAAMEDAEPGRFYPRYGHPNSLLLEATVAQLEGASACVSFASGMAAISAIPLALLRSGDGFACARACYGGTNALLGELLRFGIEVSRFDAFDPASLDRVLDSGVRLVHVESPVNPTARILDLRAIAERVHARGALLSCDATFLPPPMQRALSLGVDLVVHSATKFLGGHSDILAGVVSGSRALIAKLERWRRYGGAVLGPDDAWLLRRSLETLELRTRAQCASARELAFFLAEHPGVARVHYPELPGHPDAAFLDQQSGVGGSTFTFEVVEDGTPEGGERAATRVYDRLRVFRRAVSLGGVESLACLPADTSHHSNSADEMREMGFEPHAIRLSVGLEPVAALREDLAQALDLASG